MFSNQCFSGCQPCIPCPPPCPPKEKKPCCFFGKVEQKNVNEQNATIYQYNEQTNVFVAKCGEEKKKPHPTYSA